MNASSPDKKHLDEANEEVRDVNLLGEKIARTARLHLPSG
jgi:hypothetical protein